MNIEDVLFNKIKREIEDKTIRELDFEFSIYQKKIVVIINNEYRYDLSMTISDYIWNMGGIEKSPEDRWKIASEVGKKVRNFINEFDPKFDISNIRFSA